MGALLSLCTVGQVSISSTKQVDLLLFYIAIINLSTFHFSWPAVAQALHVVLLALDAPHVAIQLLQGSCMPLCCS